MTALLDVILPVFIVIGAGYLAVWRGLFADSAVDGLMRFTQGFAIPCLLFRAIAEIDLGAEFSVPMLLAFYLGATSGFIFGLFGARALGRTWEDSVAIGFCGLFSNSVLLGLPIAERAFGTDALRFNYAIIAVHAPFCYLLGVTVMEMVRARGEPMAGLPRKVVSAMFHNALVIGIALGFIVNLTGMPIPRVIGDALDLIIRAALPAALFGLGGILYRYKPEGDVRIIGMICAASLVLHPAIGYGVSLLFGLSVDQLRAVVLTAAMAPGVNTYIFASIYGTAQRSAASGVLIGTAVSLLSIWLWLIVLP
ncbi:Membrane transport protein [Rhodobacteraceae bacterium THAF1]|uniref:AEC family transporter n=1 Tax=Palleronia sp. THAF1 TaxID=2587842 RepID=UPI000F407498|nr:AEC family transporter [Palleronia sp. THAF1]QFU07931.1 Membrane transport protein [Palleronia sp. THAF1]VDC25765.1 Membrane transport protein [Rhodobacteraceae bacterium THAF1]